jgi:hypothetical protein
LEGSEGKRTGTVLGDKKEHLKFRPSFKGQIKKRSPHHHCKSPSSSSPSAERFRIFNLHPIFKIPPTVKNYTYLQNNTQFSKQDKIFKTTLNFKKSHQICKMTPNI